MTAHRPSLQALRRDLVGKVRRFLKEPRVLLAEWGLVGAHIAGTSSSGNALLKLSRNSALGQRGTIIQVPRDRVIFESVRQEGAYSSDISAFLASGLDKNPGGYQGRSALIDIGANSGLITLQTARMARRLHQYYLFEPLPAHAEAIRHNLATLSREVSFEVHQLALSDHDGQSTIFTEMLNHGNSSFLQEAIAYPDEQIETVVDTVDTRRFFSNFGDNIDSFIIKSDTQGMDAVILSRIPAKIWNRVERVAVEIWALPNINEADVERTLSLWTHFTLIGWDADFRRPATLSDVASFWTGRSGSEKNLFLERKS
jgi:FkbM family methyltransferase